MIAWVVLCGAGLVMLVMSGWWAWNDRAPERDRARVALHVIRRRFEVFQFRLDTRRDAAEIRRQLDGELRDLDRQEREP